MSIDLSRLLLDERAVDRKPYEVRPAQGGMRITAFVTGGVNGRTADETAIRNLADMSEQAGFALALFTGGALPLYANGSVLLATAEGGLVTLMEEARAAGRVLRRDRFSWDNPEEVPETVFEGWHVPSERWNGFATPAFEKCEADRIAAYNAAQVAADPTWEGEQIVFDPERDAYVITSPPYADEEPELVHGSPALCEDGRTRRLYAIGSWAWTWMEVGA